LLADDVVYVEHNAKAIESAKAVGIASYHYDRDTKDLISLKEFLDTHI
jgi:hypothetical protein